MWRKEFLFICYNVLAQDQLKGGKPFRTLRGRSGLLILMGAGSVYPLGSFGMGGGSPPLNAISAVQKPLESIYIPPPEGP